MTKIEQLKSDIEKLEAGIKSSTTPDKFKDDLRKVLNQKKSELESLQSEAKKPTEKKETKPEPKVEKKPTAVKKSPSKTLEDCREILKKYSQEKTTAKKRVEKRKRQGKPAELTPSETVSKTAKSVKAKVVELKEKTDKGLPANEINKLASGIISTIKSTLSGIKDNVKKRDFINQIKSELNNLSGNLTKVAMDGGMMADGEYGAYKVTFQDDTEDSLTWSEYAYANSKQQAIQRSAESLMRKYPNYNFGKMKVIEVEEGEKFADGGMMADGGWIVDNDGEVSKIDASTFRKYLSSFKKSDYWKQTRDSNNVKTFVSIDDKSKTTFTKIKMADGGMMEKGGYNRGGAWTKDRNEYNKSESYEIPLSQRKMEMGGKLNSVKVIFQNPKYNYTTNVSANTTEQDARDYFVGKMFDMGVYPNEDFQRVIDIEYNEYADGGLLDMFSSADGTSSIGGTTFNQTDLSGFFGYGGSLGEYYKKKSYRYDEGGYVDENTEMLMSQVKEIRHHADEIQAILNKNTKVESWVLAKAERSSTDLSDITHYLDGRVQEMEKGGRYNTGRAWTLDHNQHNKSEDYEVSSQNRKFAKGGISEQDVNELKNILDKDYVTFVKLLGENIKDPKFKSTVVELAKLNKTKFRNIDVPCDKLIPTQNEISLDKSLAFPLTSAYDAERYLKAEEPLKIKGNRILTCDNGKYVIDGHHRWSQVFVLNPKAKMACTDFYELKDPFTGLKATQIGISADLGYLPTQNVQDINLLTVSEKTLKDYVTTKMTNEVREVFKDNGIDNPEEHIWRNVLLLKSKNKPIKNAPSRDYMPQTDLAENFAEYVPNVKNFARGGMIEVGDLVRVKKYGWVMRVAGFEDGFYYLENDREGTMNGNAGSYLPHDIESFEKYENGGMVKWQDVEVGDSANVKSENKTGLVIKTYGRKFHLKFVDGSEKTYDASELTFIKDDEDFANGGMVTTPDEDKRNFLLENLIDSNIDFRNQTYPYIMDEELTEIAKKYGYKKHKNMANSLGYFMFYDLQKLLLNKYGGNTYRSGAKELLDIGTMAKGGELESAKREAIKESEMGYGQYVNKTKQGYYYVSDFYDTDETIYAYENGKLISDFSSKKKTWRDG